MIRIAEDAAACFQAILGAAPHNEAYWGKMRKMAGKCELVYCRFITIKKSVKKPFGED